MKERCELCKGRVGVVYVDVAKDGTRKAEGDETPCPKCAWSPLIAEIHVHSREDYEAERLDGRYDRRRR